jgi:hypothetical protein
MGQPAKRRRIPSPGITTTSNPWDDPGPVAQVWLLRATLQSLSSHLGERWDVSPDFWVVHGKMAVELSENPGEKKAANIANIAWQWIGINP